MCNKILKKYTNFGKDFQCILSQNVWDIKKYHADDNQISVGFLCYDHNGQLLEGRLNIDIQTNEHTKLVEGDTYVFSKFSVIHNSRHRKLTQLPYYILIDKKTIASRVTGIGPVFPVHTFSPQDYKNLLRLVTTLTYLPDVVGQIVLIQKISQHHPESNTDATIGLKLNRSIIVKLLLYDKQAAEFGILHNKKNRKFKVVVITSIIPKLCQGKLLLSSSPATNFYFNKSIDCIKQFRRRVRDFGKNM
ncbi:unnamed protein product [Brassica rapa]|uniref:DUF223 domain-containing protein n=1 Tax=Brassica campestris TaxID=3711 RepID=A0A3P6AG42_BRACM|nr:unnamed protein product [Brassica rapa]VDC92736.1 unnamed protein product [Brassica rapa]